MIGVAMVLLREPFQGKTKMFKTIGAVLLAASVIATPALATGTAKSAGAVSVTKSTQIQAKAAVKPAGKARAKAHARKHAWANLMNANARMGRGKHHRFVRPHHHHGKVVVIRGKARR